MAEVRKFLFDNDFSSSHSNNSDDDISIDDLAEKIEAASQEIDSRIPEEYEEDLELQSEPEPEPEPSYNFV